jgi:F-type H+-transporting ATPase subunit delta
MSDRTDSYAIAVAAVAGAEGALDSVADELHQFARALESNDNLRNTLADRSIPAGRRLGVISDVLGGAAHPITANLVNMIVGADRGNELVAIADAVVAQAASSRGQQVAEVRSAVALTDDQVSRLAAALGNAVGGSVDVKVTVDPTVMGGIVAQIGDTIIDGSVKTRLDKLKERV